MKAILSVIVFLLVAISGEGFALGQSMTVKKGDTFCKIAKKYHAPMKQFKKLNIDKLRYAGNFDLIFPGQVFDLPSAANSVNRDAVKQTPGLTHETALNELMLDSAKGVVQQVTFEMLGGNKMEIAKQEKEQLRPTQLFLADVKNWNATHTGKMINYLHGLFSTKGSLLLLGCMFLLLSFFCIRTKHKEGSLDLPSETSDVQTTPNENISDVITEQDVGIKSNPNFFIGMNCYHTSEGGSDKFFLVDGNAIYQSEYSFSKGLAEICDFMVKMYTPMEIKGIAFKIPSAYKEMYDPLSDAYKKFFQAHMEKMEQSGAAGKMWDEVVSKEELKIAI